MGGVARAPVERGDASDAFALELIVGIFYIGRHPFARRAGERRPIVRKDAEALEIAFRIAAANQDTELLVAAETAAGARVTADRIFLIERLVSNLRVRRKNERLGEVERGLGHEVDHAADALRVEVGRSEEHTSELQSLMRISYAVFCLKKK